MSLVVDVDCHFDVQMTPETHPFASRMQDVPAIDDFIADCLVGDLLRHLPDRSRFAATAFVPFLPPENASSAQQATSPGRFEPQFPLQSPDERVAWLARVGIDRAFFNPGSYAFLLPSFADDPAAVRACNDFAADRLAGHTDRLIPVSVIPWGDADDAIAELGRTRARGSRAFWVSATPFAGQSPAHPDLDPLWSAATDLGMLAFLHVGNAPTRFDGGWADAGWELPGGTGVGGQFRFANAFRNHAAEMLIGSMVYGGVFGRHPNLTVVTEELGVAWLPHFVKRCASLDPAGSWPFDLSPSEMLRSHIRVTPLPGLGDGNVLDGLLDELPDMLVFSSDFGHGEGSTDPIAVYEPELSMLDAHLRGQFLGDNIATCFARMGDPL